MTVSDVAATLRKVSALRSLCLRLPHAPTPAEARLLERFEALATAPARATAGDLDAIAAGLRNWWRGGRPADIRRLASELPKNVIESDRRLVTFRLAAEQHAVVGSLKRDSKPVRPR